MAVRYLEKEQKMSRKSDLDRLDELIRWYEKFKPEAGRRIPIFKTPRELHKMLSAPIPRDKEGKESPQAELLYKGRTIVAVGPQRSA